MSWLDRVWGVIWTKAVSERSLGGARQAGYLNSAVCQSLQQAHFTHLYYFSGLWAIWPQSNPTILVSWDSGLSVEKLGQSWENSAVRSPSLTMVFDKWGKFRSDSRCELTRSLDLTVWSMNQQQLHHLLETYQHRLHTRPPESTCSLTRVQVSLTNIAVWESQLEQNHNVGLLKPQICCPHG